MGCFFFFQAEDGIRDYKVTGVQTCALPISIHYGLHTKDLERAAPDAIVMHPGPINRGIEIASELADGNRSLILDQVANGVAVRMAVLYLLGGGAREGLGKETTAETT